MDPGTLWRIRPHIRTVVARQNTPTTFVSVAAWRVHLRFVNAGSTATVDGENVFGMMLDAAAVLHPYDLSLGGLFDGHARPILVVHTFELQATDKNLTVIITEEHLEAHNR